jgi:hypothetical protein
MDIAECAWVATVQQATVRYAPGGDALQGGLGGVVHQLGGQDRRPGLTGL